mgnify:FL=1
MSSWSRLIFEKENPTTTTETNTAPALASTAATVNDGPTQVFSVVNPSNSQSINLYDNDTITFVVLPNTALTFNFPITFNNSLKVKNTGVSTVDYSIQYTDF